METPKKNKEKGLWGSKYHFLKIKKTKNKKQQQNKTKTKTKESIEDCA